MEQVVAIAENHAGGTDVCNFAEILSGIGIAQLALIGAIALVAVAIVANSSFILAPTATLPFGLGVVAVMGVAGTLGLALSGLDNPACTSAGRCATEYAAAHDAITAMTAAITATFVLGIIAMAASSVPVAGAIAMGAYTVGLAGVALGMGPATQAVAALQHCVESSTAINAGDVLTVTGYIVSLVGAGFLLVAIGVGRGDRDGPLPTSNGPKPD